MIWRPTGIPSDFPHGTEMAGMPARLAGTVRISARYMESGSVFSFSLNAMVGIVGPAITSTSRKIRLKSARTFSRATCAFA